MFFISLSEGKAKMKTESGWIFFLYATSLTNLVLVACKPAFLYHRRGKQNYQTSFVYRSDLGEHYF